jgi:sulfide:quinone oxidoreductase
MSTSEFVKKSPLANEGGFVDVDKLTLKHVKFDNVYSLGDVSSLPTSKTAAAITEQSGVLAANLTNALQNNDVKPLEYSGYTSCPLITGKGKLILAEFSGYTGQPLETFPIDQSLERKSMYILTKDIIPEVYWNGLLKGRWSGPGPIRNLWNK